MDFKWCVKLILPCPNKLYSLYELPPTHPWRYQSLLYYTHTQIYVSSAYLTTTTSVSHSSTTLNPVVLDIQTICNWHATTTFWSTSQNSTCALCDIDMSRYVTLLNTFAYKSSTRGGGGGGYKYNSTELIITWTTNSIVPVQFSQITRMTNWMLDIETCGWHCGCSC